MAVICSLVRERVRVGIKDIINSPGRKVIDINGSTVVVRVATGYCSLTDCVSDTGDGELLARLSCNLSERREACRDNKRSTVTRMRNLYVERLAEGDIGLKGWVVVREVQRDFHRASMRSF